MKTLTTIFAGLLNAAMLHHYLIEGRKLTQKAKPQPVTPGKYKALLEQRKQSFRNSLSRF